MKVRFGKKDGKKKTNLAPSLNLTALIDAFSILIIFMIFTMANGEYEPKDGVQLAEVTKAEAIEQSMVITVTKDQYSLNKKAMSLDQIQAVLGAELKGSKKAVVEADRSTPYSKIQPVMALLSKFDIETIQMAVAAEVGL